MITIQLASVPEQTVQKTILSLSEILDTIFSATLEIRTLESENVLWKIYASIPWGPKGCKLSSSKDL